jgi:hypothetical protein
MFQDRFLKNSIFTRILKARNSAITSKSIITNVYSKGPGTQCFTKSSTKHKILERIKVYKATPVSVSLLYLALQIFIHAWLITYSKYFPVKIPVCEYFFLRVKFHETIYLNKLFSVKAKQKQISLKFD